MKRLFLILTVILLPFAVFAKGEREGIVAMSYNIRNSGAEDGTNSWQYRYPASAMMLDDQRPDVVGMQEVLFDQFDYLGSVLDKYYKIIGVGRDDGKKAGEFMAVMYNTKTTKLQKWGTFWLSETPDQARGPGEGRQASGRQDRRTEQGRSPRHSHRRLQHGGLQRVPRPDEGGLPGRPRIRGRYR